MFSLPLLLAVSSLAAVPVRTAIVLDATWSMDQELAKTAVELMYALAGAQDQVAVIVMKERAELLVPMRRARDPEALRELDAAMATFRSVDERAELQPALELAAGLLSKGPITAESLLILSSGRYDGTLPISAITLSELAGEEIGFQSITLGSARIPAPIEELAHRVHGRAQLAENNEELLRACALLAASQHRASFLTVRSEKIRVDPLVGELTILAQRPGGAFVWTARSGFAFAQITAPAAGVYELGVAPPIYALISESALELSAAIEKDALRVQLYDRDVATAPPPGLGVWARVRDPEGDVRTVTLEPGADGVLSAALPAERSGLFEAMVFAESATVARSLWVRGILERNVHPQEHPPVLREAISSLSSLALSFALLAMIAVLVLARKRSVVPLTPVNAAPPFETTAPVPPTPTPPPPPPAATIPTRELLRPLVELSALRVAHNKLEQKLSAQHQETTVLAQQLRELNELEGLAPEHKHRAAAALDAMTAFQADVAAAGASFSTIKRRFENAHGELEALRERD